MHEQQEPPSSPRADVPQSVRVQEFLATEHWSLLAARDVTYRAVFSRAAIFLTVVSATVVALALVARATEFGHGFTAFALLVLPVALFVGLATYIRLIEARIDDFWLLSGMNRVRHAYLEIAPGLEPYFVTGHHDDEQGLYETYGPGTGSRFYRLIGETSTLVAVIDAGLAGVIVGLVANAAGTGSELSLFIGAVLTTVLVVSLVKTSRRLIERGRRLLEPASHDRSKRHDDTGSWASGQAEKEMSPLYSLLHRLSPTERRES